MEPLIEPSAVALERKLPEGSTWRLLNREAANSSHLSGDRSIHRFGGGRDRQSVERDHSTEVDVTYEGRAFAGGQRQPARAGLGVLGL